MEPIGMAMLGAGLRERRITRWLLANNKIQEQVLFLALLLATAVVLLRAEEQGRISNGRVPPPGKYPSLARLINAEYNNASACVLSILNRDWLVTSADCFTDFKGPIPVEGLFVVVGDEIKNETEPYERAYTVERVIIHHRVNTSQLKLNRFSNDDVIAVVKVRPPISFSNRVTPTNLPTTCKEFESGVVGVVAGYGTYQEFNALQQNHRLMEITNNIIPADECSRRLGLEMDDRFFCGEAINNMSTCALDAGAAMYVVKSDAQMVLVGFLAFYPFNGVTCGLDGTLAVFTRLSSYLGWIHRRISGCGNHQWWYKTPNSNQTQV